MEIKAIDPTLSINEAMEKQMRTERDKRALILEAEAAKAAQFARAAADVARVEAEQAQQHVLGGRGSESGHEVAANMSAR